MLNLIRNGGVSMLFILAFGSVTLVTAFAFAVRPGTANERFLSWMAGALLGAILCGVSQDLATTFFYVSAGDFSVERRVQIAMEGAAESLAPAILGFAMMSLVALMMAFGKRRLDGRRP